VESGGSIYPVDVKKKRGTLISLAKYREHNHLEFAIKISQNNYGYSGDVRILTVPFYETSFLAEDLAAGTLSV